MSTVTSVSTTVVLSRQDSLTEEEEATEDTTETTVDCDESISSCTSFAELSTTSREKDKDYNEKENMTEANPKQSPTHDPQQPYNRFEVYTRAKSNSFLSMSSVSESEDYTGHSEVTLVLGDSNNSLPLPKASNHSLISYPRHLMTPQSSPCRHDSSKCYNNNNQTFYGGIAVKQGDSAFASPPRHILRRLSTPTIQVVHEEEKESSSSSFSSGPSSNNDSEWKELSNWNNLATRKVCTTSTSITCTDHIRDLEAAVFVGKEGTAQTCEEKHTHHCCRSRSLQMFTVGLILVTGMTLLLGFLGVGALEYNGTILAIEENEEGALYHAQTNYTATPSDVEASSSSLMQHQMAMEPFEGP